MARLLGMSMQTSFYANVLDNDPDHYEIDHPTEAEDRYCCICANDMYDDKDKQVMDVSVYQCGHALCTQCAQEVFEKSHTCPECREPIVSIMDIPVSGPTHQRIMNESLHSVATDNVTEYHTKYVMDIPDMSDHNRSHQQTATVHHTVHQKFDPLAYPGHAAIRQLQPQPEYPYRAAAYAPVYTNHTIGHFNTARGQQNHESLPHSGHAAIMQLQPKPEYPYRAAAHAPVYTDHTIGHLHTARGLQNHEPHHHATTAPNTQTQPHHVQIRKHTVGYHTNTGLLNAIYPTGNNKPSKTRPKSGLSSYMPRAVRKMFGHP